MYVMRNCRLPLVISRRMSSKPKNHYDSLGVAKGATQAEIKSAYYELSKAYHPDSNQGSVDSLNKFRQVNDAYEVLGNVKSRKIYDRGLAVGSTGTILHRDDVEDDPTARFYQKREKRSKVPKTTESNSNTDFNFDEWARAHYTAKRIHRYAKKCEFDHNINLERKMSAQNSEVAILFAAIIMIGFVTLLGQSVSRPEDFDRPKKKEVLDNR